MPITGSLPPRQANRGSATPRSTRPSNASSPTFAPSARTSWSPTTLLAVHAAGLEDLYPQAGPPWQPSAFCLSAHPHSGARELANLVADLGKHLRTVPDDVITATIDVRPWIEQKWAAIHAHQSEATRARSLPALLAGLPAKARERILATEWFIRHELTPTPGGLRELTA